MREKQITFFLHQQMMTNLLLKANLEYDFKKLVIDDI